MESGTYDKTETNIYVDGDNNIPKTETFPDKKLS